jgi:glyoxylase-like metal-dependent hydrolase (beta-lactamase superfamily II)
MKSKDFLIDAFDPCFGQAVRVSSTIVRVTARNPGPFVRWGTNTYLVGENELAVIDPGPDIDDHWIALRSAIGRRRITHVCVSHEHPDHSPLAFRMAAFFNAPIIMRERVKHRRERQEARARLGIADDPSFGGLITSKDWAIRVVPTPGHTQGHISFELISENVLLSGDHVMAWATPAIHPPEGDMDAYLKSLDETIAAGYARLVPAHGPPVDDPAPFLQAYRNHRLARERQVLAAVQGKARGVYDIVAALYAELPDDLVAAAAGTVLAHLMRLQRLGLATEVDGRWRARTEPSRALAAV